MYLLPSPFFFGNTKPLRGGEGEPRYVVEKINQEKCYRGKRTGFLFIHDRSLLGCPRYLSQGYQLSGIVTCRRTIRASFLSSTERETYYQTSLKSTNTYAFRRFSRRCNSLKEQTHLIRQIDRRANKSHTIRDSVGDAGSEREFALPGREGPDVESSLALPLPLSREAILCEPDGPAVELAVCGRR